MKVKPCVGCLFVRRLNASIRGVSARPLSWTERVLRVCRASTLRPSICCWYEVLLYRWLRCFAQPQLCVDSRCVQETTSTPMHCVCCDCTGFVAAASVSGGTSAAAAAAASSGQDEKSASAAPGLASLFDPSVVCSRCSHASGAHPVSEPVTCCVDVYGFCFLFAWNVSHPSVRLV